MLSDKLPEGKAPESRAACLGIGVRDTVQCNNCPTVRLRSDLIIRSQKKSAARSTVNCNITLFPSILTCELRQDSGMRPLHHHQVRLSGLIEVEEHHSLHGLHHTRSDIRANAVFLSRGCPQLPLQYYSGHNARGGPKFRRSACACPVFH